MEKRERKNRENDRENGCIKKIKKDKKKMGKKKENDEK